MAITAAQVEANGWVLRLTLTGAMSLPNTNFGGYVFDPDGAPRVAIASLHAGFVKSGGAAVSGVFSRTVVGTFPLRKPVVPATPTIKVIDETDLGGGSIQVRIALSETIYATDTGLSLTVLAGWRTGAGAQAGLSVSNASTVAAPVPIFRWALAPYEAVSGAFRLSLIVASHHPVGFDPVAGVKFTVTDGVTVKTVWATALATDNSLGDNLRCHTVLVDPGTATALTAGLLRCDAEVYPYLGAMRSTDAAGTRSMAGLATAGLANRAQAPFVVGYDPAGTRYSNQYAYVDFVNGTTVAAAAMIGTTRAAAKAVAPGARPKDVITAIAAARLLVRALPAANGGTAAVNSVDGVTITLAPQVHAGGLGTATVSSSTTCTEIPAVIEGDPDNGNPRLNCVLQTPAASAPSPRIPRVRFRNLRMEVGTATFAGSTLVYIFLDNVEVTAKAGLETVTNSPFGPTGVGGNWHYCITRSKLWRMVWSPASGSAGACLFRGNEFSRRVAAITMVKNRWIPKAEDGFTAALTTEGFSTWNTSTQLGPLEDVIVGWNDFRKSRYPMWSYVRAPAALAGMSFSSVRRHVLINNLFERISDSGDTSDSFWSFASAATCTVSYCIFEGNTHAGNEFSAFYNAPTIASVADTDSNFSETICIRLANNATDRNASKQDDFNDPDVIAIRNAGGDPRGHGYRPQLVQCWDTHWGVNQEANVDVSRKGNAGLFMREYFGRRGVQYVSGVSPGFTDDRSESATNTGLGNYVPLAGSVLLGRVTRGNSDRDWAGNARLMNGASGAIEAASEVTLAGASGRHGHAAGSPVLGWAGVLTAAGTVMQLRCGGGLISGDTGSVLIAPDNSRIGFATPPILLLPDGMATLERTMLVRADARIFIVRETKREI